MGVSSTFCILPFVEIDLKTNGALRPCCAYDRHIQAGGRPMSVYEHSLDQITNSDDIRDIRGRMIAGKPDAACAYCIRAEHAGLPSMRTDVNAEWARGQGMDLDQSFDELAATMALTGNRVTDGLTNVNLDMGNLCNLKCRMCNSGSSSMIANDPTHSRWVGRSVVAPARWRGSRLNVAPRPVLGVQYDGFSAFDTDQTAIWSDGRARITLASPVDAAQISVGLSLPAAAWVTMTFGSQKLVDEQLTAGPFTRTVELESTARDATILALQSADASGAVAKIGVTSVSLQRETKGRSEVAFNRLPRGEQWFESRQFLTTEVLARPKALRQVRLIGGEPLLIPQCYDVMRHLMDSGAAGHIRLSLSTNGTVYSPEFIDLASKFEGLVLQVSLDGFGATNDYIRFPSVWSEISANLRRMTDALPNAYIRVSSTFQAYNMLDLVDLVRWCDENSYRFHYSTVAWPRHLDAMVMPEMLRREAAGRLRRYIARNDKTEWTAERDRRLQDLAVSLETHRDHWTDEGLRTFMTFTNDLDATRSQRFAEAFPEYVALLGAAGHPWIDDRRFATK